jgi:radical SAM superfamily enzyme YgiQ (UPF0313 family)
MVDSVKEIQRHGLIVSGGFIVGFDNDSPNIFDEQINFIQKSGIVTAMVGLLNAPIGTRLFNRLNAENRILKTLTGDNMDGSMNFIPKMGYPELLKGYKRVLDTIYSQKSFYNRTKTFLKEYRPPSYLTQKIRPIDIKALFQSMFLLGVVDKERIYYWKLFMFSLFKYPKNFPLAIKLMIYGFHFRKVATTI